MHAKPTSARTLFACKNKRNRRRQSSRFLPLRHLVATLPRPERGWCKFQDGKLRNRHVTLRLTSNAYCLVTRGFVSKHATTRHPGHRMKREMLPVLQMARQGDPEALHQLGRGYLCGHAPLSFHPETGIRYLLRAANAGCVDALTTLAETLSLKELVRYQLLPQLRQAAARGVRAAELKLGLWLTTETDGRSDGLYWLRLAAGSGMPEARIAYANALVEDVSPDATSQALRLLRAESLAGNPRAWAPLAQAAFGAGDLPLFAQALERACKVAGGLDGTLSTLVLEALNVERGGGITPVSFPPSLLRAALTQRADDGDASAMLFLGRALCGLDENLRRRAEISSNRRLGMALTLLTNAANAGETEAWLALADLYGRRPRLPFAAASHRYCLDRAASAGSVEAAVRLGRLLLETPQTGQDLQRAMELLYAAAQRGNSAARALLERMAFPVAGDAQAARSAVALVSRSNVLLGSRLALARAFGLTQHEALTIDVARASRAWGLWVDSSAFFTQRRKATPRVVPITSPDAAAALQRAKAMFANINPTSLGPEGNYRTRVYRMRAAFDQFRLSDTLFFARASGAEIGTLLKRERRATSLASALVDRSR